jgi:hypothetical protein
VPGREQRDVALTGTVEPVTDGAAEGACVLGQFRPADRAGQQGDSARRERPTGHERGGTGWNVTSCSAPSAAVAVT